MKLLLCLFSLVAARFESSLGGVHANSHSEMRSLWQAKGTFLQTLSARKKFHTLGTPAETCQATYNTFQTAADRCLPSVGAIFTPNSNITSAEVHSAIEAYCAPTACDNDMKTAALAIKTDCVDNGVLGEMCAAYTDSANCTNATVCAWDAGHCHINGEFFGTLKMVLGVFCLKDDATPPKLCIPSFFDFVKTEPTNRSTALTQLTNGCDACTLKVFKVWSKTEPLRAAVHFIQLSLVCLKRLDKFCAIHQMDLDASASTAPQCDTFSETNCAGAVRKCRWNGQKCEELFTSDKLALLCHPCTLVYSNRALLVLRLMDSFSLPDPNNQRRDSIFILRAISYTVNGVCSTDLEDKFCMPKLQATPTDLTCAGMGNYIKTVGCCAPSLIEFAQGLCNLDQVVHPLTSDCQPNLDALKTQINSCPGITLGKPCAQIKYQLVHEAVVSGVAAAWYLAHKAELEMELKKVIAFAIGVDIALIAEIKTAAATSGRRLLAAGDLQVTTTISIPQFSANQAAMEGLQGELDPLGLNDAVQTAGGSLGSVSVTTVSTTNVAVVSPNSNSASAATPALVVAVVVVGLLF
jgi:hypothetical protein